MLNCTMKWLLNRLLLCTLFYQLSSSHTQAQSTDTVFKVLSLPAKLNYSKEALDKEIARATSKAQVRRIILSKKFAPARIVLLVQPPQGNPPLWTLNIGNGTEIFDDQIDIMSRHPVFTTFYRLDDFQRLFKDTLLLLDTLRITMQIKDPAYPPDQYMLQQQCGIQASTRAFPYNGTELYLGPQLASLCDTGFTDIHIFHASRPDRYLAGCQLRFLDPEERKELEMVARGIKAAYPRMDIQDLTLVLDSFTYKNYGHLFTPNWPIGPNIFNII